MTDKQPLDFSALCTRGYFPEGLPNTFTSQSFGDWVNQQKKDYVELKKRFRCLRYSASKRNGQRRTFLAPNPHSQFNMQVFFEKNSDLILKLVELSEQSLSQPEASEGRCVKITPHSVLAQERFKKLSAYRFIAYIDISRFYHSIYTHSLPWAAHGKESAKKDTAPDSKQIVFNRADQLLRNAQDGQTLGIPVGPDSSRVLAEILNASIDQKFALEHPNAEFIRHVDDVWIGANTYDDAKLYLQGYRNELLEFELDINESKTKIRQNHIGITDAWPHEIDAQLIRARSEEQPEAQKRSLLYVFQVCFDKADHNQDDAIVRYLIRRLDESSLFASEDNWEILESFLLQCALHFPHTIDYVARIISWRSITKQSLRTEAWHAVVRRLLVDHSRIKNDSEVAWALWLCLHANFSIDVKHAQEIIKLRNDFCGVLLFLLDQKKLIEGGIDKKAVIQNFDLADATGQNWLLAHEVRVNGWIPDQMLTLSTDTSFLESLRNSSVSFIDPELKPPVFYSSDGKLIEDVHDIKSAIEGFDDDYDDIDLGALAKLFQKVGAEQPKAPF